MKFSLRSFAALAASFLCIGAVQAQTSIYTTQILGTSDGSVSANRIEIEWTTAKAFNSAVTASDLSSLTYSIYNDSTLVYNDQAIISGAVQPIGGVVRTIDDLVFNATSGVSVQEIDNDLNQLQFGEASGMTYNLYTADSNHLNLAYYVNGVLQGEDTSFTVTSQHTTTTAVPEPSTYAAIAGVLALGFVAMRRKRA